MLHVRAIAVGMVALALPVVLAGAATAVPPRWTSTLITAPADGSGPNYAGHISCVDETLCVAVGGYDTAQGSRPFLVTLDGAAQSAVAAPLPSDATPSSSDSGVVFDVSCPANGRCVAVGQYPTATGQRPLLETRGSDGIWTASTVGAGSNTTAGWSLQHVACTGMNCLATGVDQDSNGLAAVARTASGWAVVSRAVPGGGMAERVDDVACSPDGHCFGEGLAFSPAVNGDAEVVFALAGHAFTATPLPDGTGVGTGIACTAGAHCFVLAYHGANRVAALDYHAGAITIDDIALPAGVARLGVQPLAIGCSSTSICAATATFGYDDPQEGQITHAGLVMVYADGVWTAQRAPRPRGESDAGPYLRSVSCSVAGTCVAVGASHIYAHGAPEGSLVETYTGGRWQARDLGVPGTEPGAVAQMTAVACAQDSCTALGETIVVQQQFEPWTTHGFVARPVSLG